MGTLRVSTATAYEPITSAEAKTHLRVDHSADDSLIAVLITAAREMVEHELWRTTMPCTYTLTLDSWPSGDAISLPMPPLASVSSITYVDSDGVSHALDSATYRVDTMSEPGRIVLAYGCSWPSDTLRTSGAITVTYIGGVASAMTEAGTATAHRALVSARHKAAMLLLIGHLYENRESVVVGPGIVAAAIPDGVSRLLSDRLFSFSS